MGEQVYAGKLVTVTLGEGGKEFVNHPDVVVVVALDDRGRACLVRQQRPAVGKELWEIPAGIVEQGEAPADCARRELREEAQLEADSWEPLGGFFTSPGYSTEKAHLYIATGLRQTGGTDPDGSVEEIRWLPVEEALAQGLENIASVAGLLLAARHSR